MPRNRSSARKRLLDAAVQLFSERGFGEATTRQIAELAQVNEVTLFRNFGSKHDLLLTAIANSGLFTCDWEALATTADRQHLDAAIRQYARDRLQSLSQFPELLRSIVGESGHYTPDHRQAVGRAIKTANQSLARYLTPALARTTLAPRLSATQLAGTIDSLLFGYLVLELMTETHNLWRDREDFLNQLAQLCLQAAIAAPAPPAAPATAPVATATVSDLPADLVREILRQGKKQGQLDYAIAYVLFGAGLQPQELVTLQRAQSVSNAQQHVLQITQGAARQVPINQWIMGKRYGSYTNNPLTQWLKSRSDDQPALFLNDDGQPLTAADLAAIWQRCTADLLTPERQPPQLHQARQTWCVEMLMKGMNLEDLSILSGWDVETLQPYARRAREKAALELAIRLDQRH